MAEGGIFGRLRRALGGTPPEALEAEGRDAFVAGDYRRALDLQEQALALASSGNDRRRTAGALLALARTLDGLGRHGEAEPHARRALALTDELAGKGSLEAAASMTLLGAILREQSKVAEAEILLGEALAIRESLLPENHPDVAETLCDLADVRRVDSFVEALELARRSLAIRERALAPDDARIADSLDAVFHCLTGLDDLAAAEPLALRARSLREAALGRDHPLTTLSVINLCGLRLIQNRPDESSDLAALGLAAVRRTLGPDHRLAADCLVLQALIAKNQGLPGVACDLLEQALAIELERLPRVHSSLGWTEFTLGGLIATQRVADAGPHLDRALAIFEQLPGPGNTHLMTALIARGEVFDQEHRPLASEPLLRRALALGEESSPYGQVTVHARMALAKNLQSLSKLDEAKGLFLRLLADHEANEKCAGLIGQDLTNLGLLAIEARAFGEANAFLERALSVWRERYGEDDPDFAFALTNLAALRDAEGRAEEADALYKRVAALDRGDDSS